MSEIILENISKVYGKKAGIIAVSNLHLHVRDKEFLFLLGPSGCGKTSILRMIAGLEDITRGDIYFDGKRVNDLPPGERNIAMAFENYALYPQLTVWENIAFPLRIRKMKPEEISRRVELAAQKLHITDSLQKRPSELSGGQQQRVSIARAIVRDPKAFLLDEPLSHLDMKQKQYMRAELKRLNAELNTTMIYVTHDQREALALADRIAIIHNGKLQQIGTPVEIYSDPANEFVAGFVGETAMNFIDCSIVRQNGAYQLFSFDKNLITRIPDEKIPCYEKNFSISHIRVGIRPRQISFAKSQKSSDHVPVDIFVYESIGEKGILTVKLGNQFLKILTRPEQLFDKHERLWITFPWKELYLFSPDTGERLRDLEFQKM